MIKILSIMSLIALSGCNQVSKNSQNALVVERVTTSNCDACKKPYEPNNHTCCRKKDTHVNDTHRDMPKEMMISQTTIQKGNKKLQITTADPIARVG